MSFHSNDDRGNTMADAAKEQSRTPTTTMESSASVEPRLKKAVFPFTVFVLIGSAQLLGWNAMLNGMSGLITTVLETDDFTATATATYSTILVVVTIAFIYWNVASLYTLHSGLILGSACGLMLGLGTQYCDVTSGRVVFHILGGIIALASCLVGSSAFGYAALFPENYVGAMSAGLGMAGVISFVAWMIASHGIWPNGTADDVRNSVWLLSAVLILVGILAMVGTFFLFKRESVKALLNKSDDEEMVSPQEEGTYEKEGIMGILKRSWWMAFMGCWLLFITLLCFPIIGPLAWSTTTLEQDILMGTFQVADLVGRYLPNVMPILMVSARTESILVICRTLFVVPFILSFKLSTTVVFGDFWFQFLDMLFLALTNGWLATVFYTRISETVDGQQAKIRVASVGLVSTFIGIAAGQWVGTGITA